MNLFNAVAEATKPAPKFKKANVKFADSMYNYSTSMNSKVSDEDIIKYFKGTWFNLGHADKDNMQQCTDCIVEPSNI